MGSKLRKVLDPKIVSMRLQLKNNPPNHLFEELTFSITDQAKVRSAVFLKNWLHDYVFQRYRIF